MSGGVGQAVGGGWLPVCQGGGHRFAGRPDRQPGLLGRSPRSPRVSRFPRSWEWGVGVRPPWRRAGLRPIRTGCFLCLDCRAACAGSPLGPGASLFSTHPSNPGLGAPRPHPGRDQLLDNCQLLRSAGHLSTWLGPLPAPEDRGPPIIPGADSFHPHLQGGGAGLRSGFVAKCFLFPPLSKIFIYAQCSRGAG